MSTLPGRQFVTLIATVALSMTAGAQVTAFGERDGTFAAFERKSLAEVERFYLQCSRDAEQRLLGFGEAADCSIAHEVLLRRRFAGNFTAMLTWWQAYRLASAETLSRPSTAASDP
jgi:hypothetical protein